MRKTSPKKDPNCEEKKQLFFEIHLKWMPFMRGKCKRYFNSQGEDVVGDYLIWFMKYHCKHFNWNWVEDNGDDEKRKNRAKNYYIKRFGWFVRPDQYYNRYIRKLYGLDTENVVSFESDTGNFNDFCYGSNSKIVGGNSGKKVAIENENDSLVDMGKYGYKNLISKERDKLSNCEFKLYLKEFILFVENKIEMYKPTKIRIIKFINKWLGEGTIELNESFGTNTGYYRKMIQILMNEFDGNFSKVDEDLKDFKFKFSVI